MSLNELLILPLPIVADLHFKPRRLLKIVSHELIVLHLSSPPLHLQVPSCAPSGIDSTDVRKCPCADVVPQGPARVYTCSYEPVSILTWLRFKGLKGFQVLKGPRVSRFKGQRVSRVQGLKGFKVSRVLL